MISRFLEGRLLLTVLLLGALAWSLSNVAWSPGLVHTGGGHALRDIAGSLVQPNISAGVLGSAVRESWTTVAYAVAGLTVALAIGFPLGIAASGVLARRPWGRRSTSAIVRLVLALLRSVHELVWAWLFVVAVGLSPIAAVLALGIPYGGILGRIYSELLQGRARGAAPCPEKHRRLPVEGPMARPLPMALPDMLSYTFYRLECGIRAAAIMSFIGLGGLGHRIQLSLDDLDYNTAWTYVLVLILLVPSSTCGAPWSGEGWRREPLPPGPQEDPAPAPTALVRAGLRAPCPRRRGGIVGLRCPLRRRFARLLLPVGPLLQGLVLRQGPAGNRFDRHPAFRQSGEWVRTGRLAVDTLAMSLLSIGIAAVAALLTFMFGASNVMMGELAPYRSRAWSAGFLLTRLVFILTRGVPELIWAMLILFVLSPGILPGAIAIGIHNGGILGKLSSEVVEGLDPSPCRPFERPGRDGSRSWPMESCPKPCLASSPTCSTGGR